MSGLCPQGPPAGPRLDRGANRRTMLTGRFDDAARARREAGFAPANGPTLLTPAIAGVHRRPRSGRPRAAGSGGTVPEPRNLPKSHVQREAGGVGRRERPRQQAPDPPPPGSRSRDRLGFRALMFGIQVALYAEPGLNPSSSAPVTGTSSSPPGSGCLRPPLRRALCRPRTVQQIGGAITGAAVPFNCPADGPGVPLGKCVAWGAWARSW